MNSRKISKYFYLLSIIILFSTCQKDKIATREYPRLDIFDDIQQNESGVTFKANVISEGVSEIINKGFVWDKNDWPTINSSRILLGTHLGTGSFEATVLNDLFVDNNYSVRAFVQTENYLVYSKTVNFNCIFNSPPPQIDDFTPTHGKRGDTIIISGQNFSSVLEHNTVYIGNAEAVVNNSTPSTLSITIAGTVNEGKQHVKILVYGREFITSSTMEMTEPWQKIADFSGGARNSAFCFSMGGKGYVGGGYNSSGALLNDLWEYNPITDTWIKKADLPEGVEGNTTFATTSKAYVLSTRKLWQYDPILNQWSQLSNFPGEADKFQSAFAIGDKGYVGAGMSPIGVLKKEFWEYDESINNWTQKADYGAGSMKYGISFSIGDKGYFGIGVYDKRDFWEYNSMGNQWTKKLNLSGIIDGIETQRVLATGFSSNGKGYIATGSNVWASLGVTYNDIYEYDPVNNSCIKIINMPEEGRCLAVGFSINDKIYIGTGKSNTSSSGYNFSDFWEYDPNK